ncbi:MAG TPA: hypothetical protein VFU40_00660 [Gemmatimonadales bacterium]|nr:hypothetical protein [Gemmatimonadales bacterium]
MNGYRFPENDELLRKDEQVPLGEEPWKDLWPRAIWPGELASSVPLALRIQTDVGLARNEAGSTRFELRMPHEVALLAGTTLGNGIGAFAETEWTREEGLEVGQAKVLFQDILGLAPARAVNLWIGLQNLYPFTLADPEIDRAARQTFRWQTFRVADLLGSASGLEAPGDSFALTASQPAIEVNGLAGGRLNYALGVSQGAGATTQDNNSRKDVYYRLRWKLGGLGLAGRYSKGAAPKDRGHGQLLDHSLTIEHFGYLGEEPTIGGAPDRHRHFGVAARVLLGPLDAGVGYVWGQFDDPWGAQSASGVTVRSAFAKVEVIALPWLLPSFKVEHFDAEPESPEPGSQLPFERRTRLTPGIVALLRPNLRAVLEAELVPRYEIGDSRVHRPTATWLRLDLAF